ncbi:MAG: peptide deformylase [Gemmatimonadota bacterium]|nr:peptide deformylase [Gemmatimonadota bacterium]
MSLLDIYVLGAPVLRQVTTPVSRLTDELRSLIADMFDTMYAASGIGLAAPQVGRTERICVVDVDGAKFALINPEIVAREGSEKGEEGCLSIPEVYGDVERSARVVCRALDENGQEIEIEATELLARCIQHEIDHLHGKLFIDYLSLLKRRAAMAKWEKVRGDDMSLTRKVDKIAPETAARHHTRDDEM